MRKKLLHKTLRVYILFSLIILLVSAPLFYLLSESLFIQDADEALELHKQEFIKYSIPAMKVADIEIWNKVNRDVKIETVQQILSKDSLFDSFYIDSLVNENEPYRVLMSSIAIEGQPFTYIARMNLIESEDLIENIALLFCVMVILLLAGMFIITKRLSNKLWQPFYSTLRHIEKFEIDKNTRPQLSETNIEEFHRLNISINKLIERNTVIYKNQQEFIENAAHELQTPLAVFQAKLDTLMQYSDLTPSQADILLKLMESAARLNHLNKNLLLLSKIDNSYYSEIETISIKDVINKQLEFFTEQAEEKSISIKVDMDTDISVKSNLILTEILLSNLLLNAIKHNIPNGIIQISILHNELIISNTGNAIPIDSEKLFLRFSKSNPSAKGNGLGLAIVKKIADQNNWPVIYTYQNKIHAFTVKF